MRTSGQAAVADGTLYRPFWVTSSVADGTSSGSCRAVYPVVGGRELFTLDILVLSLRKEKDANSMCKNEGPGNEAEARGPVLRRVRQQRGPRARCQGLRR